ncbi:MAG: FkbM family methyltransferase [Opitutae bacterium]|nr:FkbM family methyltransferase [Opitutae bacterium]
MASRCKRFIRAFGPWDGLRFYARCKWGHPRRLHSRKYGTTIHLRPGTSDQFTFGQVFLFQQYDIALPFVPRRIVDAGANVGLSALYFAHRYPEAVIATLEPSAENQAQIQLNTAVHASRMRHFPMGLWRRDGALAISNPYRSHDSFIVTETEPATPGAIPAICLPTLLRELQWDSIDLLKIDIEGAEKEVFAEGYESWLPRTRAIYIELHDFMQKGCSQAVFRALSRYRFSLSLRDENLVFINDDFAGTP